MKKNDTKKPGSPDRPFIGEVQDMSTPLQGKRRRKTWFDHLLTLLIIALFAVGLYLLLRPSYVRWSRARLAQELQSAVNNNETLQISYDPEANRIQEAEYDYYEIDAAGKIIGVDPPATSATATTISQGLRYMTPIGRLEIPLLKVNIPLIKELDYYAMYYAASHWNRTPLPDQPGNSAIFIHRDSYDDYDFTRADKLKVNDPIYVTYKGERHRYTIINFDTVLPTDTINTLLTKYQSDSARYITLVTCTPIPGAGVEAYTHRLLITAILNDEAPPETTKSIVATLETAQPVR